MEAILYVKFAKGGERTDLLLATGERTLMEATEDEFWGVGDTEHMARAAWFDGKQLKGENWHGRCLMVVRDILRGRLAHHYWIVGDSITKNTGGQGVTVVTLVGAQMHRVLLLAYIVLQLPNIESLVIHVGTNDISPRPEKERSQLTTNLQAYGQRLKRRGTEAKRLGLQLLRSIQKIAHLFPAVHFLISPILPRPCDWVKYWLLVSVWGLPSPKPMNVSPHL